MLQQTKKQALDLPVLNKHIVATHTKEGKERNPYPKKIVRLHDNSKADWNIMDTCKGCKGGCEGCYAECAEVINYQRIKFDVPVSQELVPELLQKDCLKALQKPWSHDHEDPDTGETVTISGIGRRWVRNGVMGDPSYDWELAVRAAETCAMAGMPRHVIISKFWKYPTEEQLLRLALSGAVLHWSVIPGYEWTPSMEADRELNRSITIMDILTDYNTITKQDRFKSNFSESVLMRLCGLPWAKQDPIGALLDECQEGFRDMAISAGFRVLDTPWRLRRSDSRYQNGWLDDNRLVNPKSYAYNKLGIKKANRGRMVAQALFFLDDPYMQRDAFDIGCVTGCAECPNQCGTENAESERRDAAAMAD